jgi:hypothetical protein
MAISLQTTVFLQTTVYPRKNEFWQVVERTLERVFQRDPADARQLRQEIDNLSDEEQLIFYHAEPLDIAADLADMTPSSSQVQQYDAVARNLGWVV